MGRSLFTEVSHAGDIVELDGHHHCNSLNHWSAIGLLLVHRMSGGRSWQLTTFRHIITVKVVHIITKFLRYASV